MSRAWAATPTATSCCTPSPTRCWAPSPPQISARYSPPSDPRWKGADSDVFLKEALKRVRAAGYQIQNLDSTLILQSPKIGPHAEKIRARLAELLSLAPDCIGIRAKTPEGMGTDNAAIAHATVLLSRLP